MAKEKVWTWDSLITKYIIEKTRRGYDIGSAPEEIADFLDFITYFVTISSSENNYSDVLKNYLSGHGSKKKEWSIKKEEFVYTPIVKQTESGLIVPTYQLNDPLPKYSFAEEKEAKAYDECFNSYLMKYIEKNCSKRKFITNESLNDDNVQFGENVAASLLMQIWNNRISYYCENGNWPIQCKDIKKNLLDRDLSSIIGLPPIREELIDFYFTISERIMNEAQNNLDFRMTNFEDEVLAKSNFDLVMEGYPSYYRTVNRNQSGIIIDRSQNEFQMVIDWYNGNIKKETIDTSKVLNLVRDLKGVRK